VKKSKKSEENTIRESGQSGEETIQESGQSGEETIQESNKSIEVLNKVPQNTKPNFFSATIEELKLVVWPSKQQLFSESVSVILMVTISAAAIAAVSRFYGWGASQIFR
tara:strand:+ start:5894 stop:6220 length:327 start_codon:yes stop_codon:yes gene_type:complete